jgi:molybdate transport system ATP-binding protein
MQALVELSGVNVDLNGTRVLHDITWSLLPGQHWAVLGPNGAGKSTLLRLIRGEIWPAPTDGGTRLYGFDGERTPSPIGIKQKIALVSAEQQTRYMRTEWHMKCWQVVFTGLFDSDLMYHHPTPEQLMAVDTALAELGALELRDADFHKLSQGQLRKVLIARAIIRKPPVLICDEIGVGLDKAARHTLLDAIARVAADGTQVLMTSHRREELLPSIQHVALLEAGRLSAQPLSDHATRGKWPPRPRPVTSVTSAFRPAQTSFVLSLENVTLALEDGARVVLRDVNWRVNAGEHWRITGDNGAGKTTLLKAILGELWPARGGRLDRFGRADFTDMWEIKRQIGYVSQDLQTRYHHDQTARQVVGTGFNASIGWLNALSAEQQTRVDAVLAEMGVSELADRSLQAMSFGQARKVLVARALVNEPRLLILDEVFDGLDAQFREDLAARFTALAAHTTILLVSHFDGDLALLPCVTRTLRIEDGTARVDPA